jgi:hypothetical protein
MSVSSVSQRAMPQPVRPQQEREPAKSVGKQPQTKALPSERTDAKVKASAHYADATYSRTKENTAQHAQPVGKRVDIKA